MQFGICNLSIIPLRAEPSERSEQVSQILFGESFEILVWKDKWAKVLTTFDRYEGWISVNQFVMLGHVAFKTLSQSRVPLTYRAVTQSWKKPDNSVLYLPIGSSLVFLEGTTCKIGNEKFEIIGEIGEREGFATTAKSFLNAPYLWGGRTHFGIDCSGFTQAVYKLHGIMLPRDAWQQAENGLAVDFLQNGKLGDLAFFDNEEGRITHVGILLNNGQIIHASGKVKIDAIDNHGIYSEDQKRYTHKLKVVKRYF